MASSTTDPKVDVKQAATSAVEYLRALIPSIPANDISLEEVEMDGRDWLVTLGFTDKHSQAFRRVMDSGRAYKQFRINSVTGQVSSMRIRKP